MPSAVKEKFVKEIAEDLEKSEHIIVTEYKGLNAEEITELRGSLRKIGAKYKVVKNRLAKIALKNIGRDLDKYMTGPSALSYAGDDIAALSKTLFNFSKDHKNLKIKAGYFFGKAVEKDVVKSIADLPSREQLLATLAATLNSPLQKLSATLNEPLRSMHTALSQVATKKEAAPSA